MTVVVRALQHDAEIDAFFGLASTAFSGYHRAHCTPQPRGSLAIGWRLYNELDPRFEATRLRGAFIERTLVGGYIHDERWQCFSGAWLRTGYVGAVVTDPGYRGLGVGSALIRDSIERARTRKQTMLVLRGIPDFYHRFGFADVMDVTEHAVESVRVRSMTDSGIVVRPAVLEDAPALLELYGRHYFSFTGTYARTLEQQEHLIRQRTSPPLLAVDETGRPRGYLLLPCGVDRSLAVEAAADNWPSALALLQYHVGASESTAEVRWPLPFGSSTYHHLADNLPIVSRTTSQPNAGWMARPADLGELCAGLLSVWSMRWSRACNKWTGVVNFEVGGEPFGLHLTPGEVRPTCAKTDSEAQVRLSPDVLAQLVFGHRPAGWAAARNDQHIAEDLVPVIAALFPTTTAWHAGSNRC